MVVGNSSWKIVFIWPSGYSIEVLNLFMVFCRYQQSFESNKCYVRWWIRLSASECFSITESSGMFKVNCCNIASWILFATTWAFVSEAFWATPIISKCCKASLKSTAVRRLAHLESLSKLIPLECGLTHTRKDKRFGGITINAPRPPLRFAISSILFPNNKNNFTHCTISSKDSLRVDVFKMICEIFFLTSILKEDREFRSILSLKRQRTTA